MIGFEENEISINANGGTELAKRKLASLINPADLEQFQIICSRERELNWEKIRVFWCHDLPEDPESMKFREQSFKDNYHKFVFISNWQMQRYQLIHGLPHDPKSIVIESGIEPAPETALRKAKDKIRLVYTSTPQRGLDILIPVFESLAKMHPEIHLDVYSSFKIYGWDDADKQFEPLYNRIRNHPQMTYHGFVDNTTLKENLNNSHIFAYPCIWLETSCRAMLEAMSAGLVCVHSDVGALPETSGGLNLMYHADLVDNNHHANIFINHLNNAINIVKNNQEQNLITFNKIFVDNRYNINLIKNKWDIMIEDQLGKYKTIESRAKPKEKFIYRTI